MSLARSTSRVSTRNSNPAWVDKAHAALLDNLEEEPEEPETASLFSAKGLKRVETLHKIFEIASSRPV